MPNVGTSIQLGGKAEVWCGKCDLKRVPEDHPRAVVCECGKTIDPDSGEERDHG